MMLSSVGSVDVLPSLLNAKYNCLAILYAHLWCAVPCRVLAFVAFFLLHSFLLFTFTHPDTHSHTHVRTRSQTCWRRRRRRCAAWGEWERERDSERIRGNRVAEPEHRFCRATVAHAFAFRTHAHAHRRDNSN